VDEHTPSNHRTSDRFTVSEAAARLGITESAVRGRINRGTLEAIREEGTVYVLLSDGYSVDYPGESNALISEMRGRIESLERQQELLERQLEQANQRDRENRRLLAAALERIPPQLEAPAEPRESPESATEEAGGGDNDAPPLSQGPTKPRSLWRRIFGV
jgi:hypothetical protein